MASSKNSVGMGRGVTAALILLRNDLSFFLFLLFYVSLRNILLTGRRHLVGEDYKIKVYMVVL